MPQNPSIGPFVNAVGYTRHTLRHTGFFQHVVKGSVCVLETAVTVEQRMCIWVSLHCGLECIEHNERFCMYEQHDK